MVFNSASKTPQVKCGSQSQCALNVVNIHQLQMVDTSFAWIAKRQSVMVLLSVKTVHCHLLSVQGHITPLFFSQLFAASGMEK